MIKNTLGLPLLRLKIRYEPDIVTARQKVRKVAGTLGFDSQDQARLATAVSELARNAFQYAGGGFVEFFFLSGSEQILNVRISDEGPGIQALDDIINGRYESKTGMGVGLAGSRKLVDAFQIETSSQGTAITLGKILGAKSKILSQTDLNKAVDQFRTNAADNIFEEMQNQNRDLLDALESVKAAKEELAELNQELAETNRGVVALYAELDEKAASLQKANEVKTSFLSNMTHEFRTPLGSILSLTRLLLDRIDGDLNDEQERQVHYIRKSAEGLLELVNDLLDLAKVEAGKVSVRAEEFSIAELVSGLRGVFRPILNTHQNLEFSIEEPTQEFSLVSDQAKVAQVLRNLVSNATKFTEEGSVRVTTELNNSGQVHFKVIDTGIGIAEENLDFIFDDYTQLESRRHLVHKGTGLGLPLSRRLARLLGGDLWVESTLGKGSTFHFVLPLEYSGPSEGSLLIQPEAERIDYSNTLSPAAPVAVPVTTTTAKNPEEPLKILLIDDDEASRYALRKSVGLEVPADFYEAVDGNEGLQLIGTIEPDLVFLDLGLPVMDGFEVLQEIRKLYPKSLLPVIINTAKILMPKEIEILSEAAHGILAKEQVDDVKSRNDLLETLSHAGFQNHLRSSKP